MTGTERILWDYRKNVKKILELRLTLAGLMSVRGANYEAHTVNGVSDAVSEVVHRKMAIEKKIQHLEREIQAVEHVKDTLDITELRDSQMLGILNRRYLEHKEPDAVMRELGITKPTYYRRNNELIERTREYVN